MNTINIALSGLKTAQSAIANESHNIANASTEGYNRKHIETQSQTLNGQGSGVAASVPHRLVNQELIQSEREKISSASYHGIKAKAFDKVQMAMGKPGGKNSLSEMINNFSSKCKSLALNPKSSLERKEALRTLDVVNQELARLTKEVQSVRRASDAAIKISVDEVNSAVREVDVLNKQIIANTRSGLPKDDLEDHRDNAIRRIAKHVDIHVREDGNGGVFLQTTGGVSLLTPEIIELNFTPTTHINAASQYDANPVNSDVSHVSFSDSAGNVINVTERIRSGDIASHIEIRDRAFTDLQAQLDRLATDLRDKINEAHNLGAGYPPASTLTGTRTFAAPAVDQFQGNGTIRFAVINKATGEFQTVPYDLDLGANNPITINNLAANINLGLNGANVAVTAEGQLQLSAANPDHGIALIPVGGPATETTTGLGFSHYFGLNDLVVTQGNVYDAANLVPGIASQLTIREDISANDAFFSRGKLDDSDPAPNVGDKAIYDGDNKAVQSLVNAFDTSRDFINAGGLGNRFMTFSDYSSAIISETARQADHAENLATKEKDALSSNKLAQGQISGVDSQESLSSILNWQKLYMGSSVVIGVEKDNFSFLMKTVG